VYVRHCPSEENSNVHVQRIESHVPADGEVRILTFTDKQFERMRVFWGKTRVPVEPAGQQLELF
jgi:CRISPR-associated protein Cas2